MQVRGCFEVVTRLLTHPPPVMTHDQYQGVTIEALVKGCLSIQVDLSYQWVTNVFFW